MPKLMTRQQAASLFQVSVKTIDQFRREGLRFIRIRGTVRLLREDVETFLRLHMVEA